MWYVFLLLLCYMSVIIPHISHQSLYLTHWFHCLALYSLCRGQIYMFLSPYILIPLIFPFSACPCSQYAGDSITCSYFLHSNTSHLLPQPFIALVCVCDGKWGVWTAVFTPLSAPFCLLSSFIMVRLVVVCCPVLCVYVKRMKQCTILSCLIIPRI